ncbi:DUF192 domain-containing protein [Brevundimonas balnearis]|uniref:DUF192 domain-containing protein n=1 Tax=Brevundimonas balnearis TaxID=1572858 RepID=A0ABV6QZD9_9CAUL
MPLTRRLLIGLAGVTVALGACASERPPLDPQGQPMEQLTIVTDSGRHTFWVEIADDAAERERGLMFRPPLPDDQGMLFKFQDNAERGFWMRNTPSSLDIIYVAADGRIVSIARHTTPYSDGIYPSNGPATGVVELRAGRSEEIGAEPGDVVEHPHFDR